MRKTLNITAGLVLTATLTVLLISCAVQKSMATKHPVEVLTKPVCSECHDDWKKSLDHGTDFVAKHKIAATQRKQACDVCHAPSFCADCHGSKEELKPSDKFKDAPARIMPHRGDYLNQHKIDGRINPASCFPCHGRQNNERCRPCHS